MLVVANAELGMIAIDGLPLRAGEMSLSRPSVVAVP
jgi:hypothetical protein